MELLFMEPVFKEAIWGGTKLRDVFGYEIPSDTCLLYTSDAADE